MFDHLGIGVTDLAQSKAFYLAALAPLGVELVMEFQGHVGIGKSGKPSFWLSEEAGPKSPLHLAFVADERGQVDAFYKAALAAGAKDNGPPGIREHYHPHYYGAFVIDRDGHNVEAVCHKPV